MKEYFFLILLTLTLLLTLTFVPSNSDTFNFKYEQNNESKLDTSAQSSEEDLVSSNSDAFELKNEQNNESKLDTSAQSSEEDLDGADEHIDLISQMERDLDLVSHMEGEIDGSIYTINTSMELYKHSGETKTKVLKFNAGRLVDNDFEISRVYVFKFGDYHFFEIGTAHFMEGYMANIHVVDLKNKEVLSTFGKCANHEEFFGLQNGVLTYMCKWNCLKYNYSIFEPKEKKFITIYKKHDCDMLSFDNKLVGLKKTDFRFKYKNEKNSVEH